MKAYILGLDVSTTCVGWALLSLNYGITDRDLRLGKIIPPKHTKRNPMSWFKRATHVCTVLDQLLEGEPVVAAAIEQLNSVRSVDTTRKLAGMSYVVQHLLYKKFGFEPSEINTATLKKGFTGSGAAKKWDVIACANKLYNLNLCWPPTLAAQNNKEINDEDPADALGAAHCLNAEVGEELRASLRETPDAE